MRKTSTTNKNLRNLITKLKEKSGESKLISRIASDLSKPSRIRREVNLSRLNHFTKENELIVVPGKVLGGGSLDHKITLYALNVSQGAQSKLEKSGCKILSISELTKEQLSGKRIRIIG
jgi:large subunit ribosomal protein L18e